MITLDDFAAAGNLRPEMFARWAAILEQSLGYTTITVPRRGRHGRRTVLRPSVGLDRLLKQIRVGLDVLIASEPHPAVHGFTKGRGIVTNAEQHLDRDMVLRVDLKDFFGSVTKMRVAESLNSAGLDPDAAQAVTSVVTLNGALPQGFSTSPVISNLTFATTDALIAELAANHQVTYSRYADDLIFSGPYASVDDRLLEALVFTLEGLGWQVNERKTRFMRRGKPQFVTGLYVGDPNGPHVPRSMKRKIRQELHYANLFGVRNAQAHSRRHFKESQLLGWADYITHVEYARHGELRPEWLDLNLERSSGSETWDDLLDEIGFPDHW